MKLSICMRLLALIRPLLTPMFFAIVLGVSGHLAASFITITGAAILLNLSLLSVTHSFVFIGFCAFARGPLRYIEQACNHYIAFRILAILRDKLFGKLRTLAPAKLEGKDKGNLISMITSDVELLEVFYAHTISPVVIALIQISVMCILFFQIHPVLALCALCIYFLIGAVLPFVISKRCQDTGIKMRNASGEYSSFVLETLLGMDDIIQYNQQTQILELLEKRNSELSHYEKNQKRLFAQNNAFSQGIMLSGNILMFAAGILLAKQHLISYREAVLAFVMLSSSYGPCAALAALGSTLQNTFAAAKRILNLLDEDAQVSFVQSDIKPEFNGVQIQDLCFSYEDEPVISHMNAELEKGKIIGIAGKSGSGKSTLLRLCMRFWESKSGSIQISNHNINSIDSNALLSMECFMVQDTWLFHDTIEENLRIAKPDASMQEIIEASRKAAVHDFIMTLPDGYQTKIEELGNSVSAGERQRIGLARVFLKQADLILLDEPTSNLDSLNEAAILKSLKDHQQNKTLVLVSHRPQTLNIADVHLSMDSNRCS